MNAPQAPLPPKSNTSWILWMLIIIGIIVAILWFGAWIGIPVAVAYFTLSRLHPWGEWVAGILGLVGALIHGYKVLVQVNNWLGETDEAFEPD